MPGDHHACALLDDGQVRCWGRNDSGQVGTGSSARIAADTNVPVWLGR